MPLSWSPGATLGNGDDVGCSGDGSLRACPSHETNETKFYDGPVAALCDSSSYTSPRAGAKRRGTEDEEEEATDPEPLPALPRSRLPPAHRSHVPRRFDLYPNKARTRPA